MSLKEYLIGDTIRFTWINSGTTPSTITLAIFTGSESVVSSLSMTSSGNGHFYHDYTTVESSAYYVAESKATIGGKPYKNRTSFKTVFSEVD